MFIIQTANTAKTISDSDRQLIDDLTDNSKRADNTKVDKNASLFTREEEMFATDRALSRLYDMQSEDYWRHREPSSSSSH